MIKKFSIAMARRDDAAGENWKILKIFDPVDDWKS